MTTLVYYVSVAILLSFKMENIVFVSILFSA